MVKVKDVEAGKVKNEVEVELGDKTWPGDDEVKTEPIAIEITAASDSKEYDGEPLTNDGYEQTAGELVKGHEIETVKVEGEQTLVGSSENVASEAKKRTHSRGQWRTKRSTRRARIRLAR